MYLRLIARFVGNLKWHVPMTLSPRKEKGKNRKVTEARFAALGKAKIISLFLVTLVFKRTKDYHSRRTVHTGVQDATMCSRKYQLSHGE